MKNTFTKVLSTLALSAVVGFSANAQCVDLSAGAYTMGFEATEDFSTWVIEDDGALASDGTTKTWGQAMTNPNTTDWGPRTGDQFMMYQWNDANAADDWAFTPCFSVVAGNEYEIRFWYAVAAFNGNTYPEKLEIGIGTAQSSASMIQTFDIGEITDIFPNYVEYVLPLTAPITGDLVLGFHVYSDANQYAMQIDDVSVEDVTSSSVQGLGLDAYINLSPNPVRDQLNIEFNSGDVSGDMNIEIVGLDGKIIRQATVNAIEGVNRETLDVSTLAEGMYFVHLFQGKRKITQKFVVRH